MIKNGDNVEAHQACAYYIHELLRDDIAIPVGHRFVQLAKDWRCCRRRWFWEKAIIRREGVRIRVRC